MIENEFKIMLSKEQYDAIHTFYSWDTEVEQVNWYYDSESGELSGRHITCRVRTLGGRFYLQIFHIPSSVSAFTALGLLCYNHCNKFE